MATLTRRQFIALGSALAASAIGARIWYVNEYESIKIPVEHYALGEEVALDGAFLNTNNEPTKGYFITVKDARLISYNDFVRELATDGSEPIDGLDFPSLVDLTWYMRSERTEKEGTGGLTTYFLNLVPKRRNTYFLPVKQLIVASQTKLRETGSSALGLSIRPGTDYELHMPFGTNGALIEYNGHYIHQACLYHMQDTEFELYLSNAPVRKIVDIECM